MKLLVPVYDLSLVNAVCTAAQAGGHIAAIANPDSGPGRGNQATPGWKNAIAKLRASGAQVLYYVDLVQWDGDQGISVPSGSVEKSEATVKAEMDKYIARYGNPVGWFFDDLWDFTVARSARLKKFVQYKGGFTVANPGAGVSQNYLATGVNVLVTWETTGYRTSQPAAWEASNGPRIGAMALGEAGYTQALNVAKARKVNLFYATNAGDDGAAYDELPPYFSAMAAAIP